MEQPPTNPRAARTRAALLAAGFELLAERPIDAIAIDEVVARAGVAKGSFFNHFTDKQRFAEALGSEVRRALEARVDAANAGVADPVRRLVGGMREGVRFAVEDRVRAIVMLRGLEAATAHDHALNAGIRADIGGIVAEGLASPEAREAGVRYWLGVCHVAILDALERGQDNAATAARLEPLMVLGLTGLGIPADRVRDAAGWAVAGLAGRG